jgi:hypothetical protein
MPFHFRDHSDVMAARAASWLCSQFSTEVMDFALISQVATLESPPRSFTFSTDFAPRTKW